jgi:hypothetical protein
LGLGFARKSIHAHCSRFSQSKASLNKALQHRSASLHWTGFKSQFCGFAAQKYSTKPQLKNCRLARRYIAN